VSWFEGASQNPDQVGIERSAGRPGGDAGGPGNYARAGWIGAFDHRRVGEGCDCGRIIRVGNERSVDGYGLDQSQSRCSSLDLLHDGLLPNCTDAPTQNFFFTGGTLEGRFKVDLGSVVPLGQVKTYS
jgi:hypothetical protein